MLKWEYIILAISLLGCMPKRPQMPSPSELPMKALIQNIDSFEEKNNLPLLHQWPKEEFWLLFKDEQLTNLIERAISQNPSLEKAHLKIEKARLVFERDQAFLFPFVRWTGDIQRNKLSKTGVFPSAPILAPGFPQVPIAPPIPFYYTQFESALNFEYDLDLFGKRRDQIASRAGSWAATLFECHLATRTLALGVTEAYFKYMGASEQAALSEALVKNYEKSIALTERRIQFNLSAEESLLTMRSHLEENRALLDQLQLAASLSKNRLLELISGDFVEEVEPVSISKRPIDAIPLPKNIPLHLIGQRLDIQAQLWLIESGLKKIDVAEKRFYPDVNLFGFIGFQTLHLHKFFEWDSVYANGTAAFGLPIFDAGLRQSELNIEGVETALLIKEYEALLLRATKEVLDSLAHLLHDQKVMASKEAILSNTKNLLTLSELKQKESLSSELDRLEKERAFLVASKQEIAAKEEQIASMIALIRALGGGFS